MCVFVLAWHLSFHRGCLPDRERGAHTKSVYGGGRLKAIIIYPRMHRGNGGSVKAFSQKEAPWMAAMQKTHLLQSCFEAWCAGRPTLPKEAEGQGCSRILHPNRHKGLTLTLFQTPLLLASAVVVYTYASLYVKTVYLQLLPALLHQIIFANFSQFCGNRRSPSVGQGVSPRSVSAGGCPTVFSAASPSEMSCPVRKIVKPSQSRAACGVWRLQ